MPRQKAGFKAVCITVPTGIKDEIDILSEKEFRTFSGYVANVLSHHLQSLNLKTKKVIALG